MNRIIEVMIEADGSVTVGARGFGADCEKATKALRDALGEETSHKRTAEFFQAPPVVEHRRQ